MIADNELLQVPESGGYESGTTLPIMFQLLVERYSCQLRKELRLEADELANAVVKALAVNRHDEARALAALSIEAVFKQYHPNWQTIVRFGRRSDIGVEQRGHFRLAAEPGVKRLLISDEQINASFKHQLVRYTVFAMLCETYPCRFATAGEVICDIEDGSNQGEYPRVAFCSALPQACLVTDPYYVRNQGYAGLRAEVAAHWVPWADRSEKVFWRGNTTGSRINIPRPHEPWHWRWLQRLHLCEVAQNARLAAQVDCGITGIVQIDQPHALEATAASGFLRPRVPKLDFMKYRYIIDIDGNANAWDGLFSALLMGACTLKIGSRLGWRQWYYDRLLPGVHYLPVKADLSDFDEVVDWALCHPAESAEIGRRARAFALSMNYEDEIDLSGARLAQMLAGAGQKPM